MPTRLALGGALFRVVNRYVGSLAPMPGVFPDFLAPVADAGRETGWGMPPRTGGPPAAQAGEPLLDPVAINLKTGKARSASLSRRLCWRAPAK